MIDRPVTRIASAGTAACWTLAECSGIGQAYAAGDWTWFCCASDNGSVRYRVCSEPRFQGAGYGGSLAEPGDHHRHGNDDL
jgi:hypothetical protein